MVTTDFGEIYFTIDTLWMIISGILVFFMGAGFAMLESGSMRSGNVSLNLVKNLLDKVSTAIGWWAIGYGIAYGDNDNGFISVDVVDYHSAGGISVGPSPGEFALGYRDIFFQWGFCFAAATIAGGAMGERINIKGYLIYTFLNAIFIYPIVVHWVWTANGWLATGFFDESFLDLAGSGVVHMVGGVAAVVGVIIIGPRKSSRSGEQMGNHNVPLVVLGTMILWMGWYGFNGGSVRITSLQDIATVAKVCLNNTLSATGAALCAVCITAFFNCGKMCIITLCNGALGGLVSITAGCGDVEPWAAFIIGILGGLVYYGFARLEARMGWDDAVEAGAVHGACGLWGLLAAGLFAEGRGLFLGQGINLLGVQLVGGLTIFAWVAFWAFVCFKSLAFVGLLRLSDTTERIGNGHDLFDVGFFAYDFSQIATNGVHEKEIKDCEEGKAVQLSNGEESSTDFISS